MSGDGIHRVWGDRTHRAWGQDRTQCPQGQVLSPLPGRSLLSPGCTQGFPTSRHCPEQLTPRSPGSRCRDHKPFIAAPSAENLGALRPGGEAALSARPGAGGRHTSALFTAIAAAPRAALASVPSAARAVTPAGSRALRWPMGRPQGQRDPSGCQRCPDPPRPMALPAAQPTQPGLGCTPGERLRHPRGTEFPCSRAGLPGQSPPG